MTGKDEVLIERLRDPERRYAVNDRRLAADRLEAVIKALAESDAALLAACEECVVPESLTDETLATIAAARARSRP